MTSSEDWELLPEEEAGDQETWQNKVNPNLFSQDQGKTYYDITEPWESGHPTMHHTKENTSA